MRLKAVDDPKAYRVWLQHQETAMTFFEPSYSHF